MRRLLLLLLLLTIPTLTKAQTTSVSATVTDADGVAWANGTYTFTSAAYPTVAIITGTLDANGAFTNVTFPINNATAGVGGRWTARICPVITAPCFSTVVLIPGGATLSLSGNLSPPAIRLAANSQTPLTAYSDIEITGAVQGNTYFNVTDLTEHTCKAIPCSSNWVSVPNSGSAGSFASLTVNPGPTSLSGVTTLSGSTGIGLLNNQLTVGPAGFRYTTIAGAIASADCPTVGCTIFVRPDVTMDTTTITITKPVHIVFDCASYTYSGTGSMFSSTAGVEGIRINGCGRSTQAFNIGTVINITNTSAIGMNMTNSPSLDLEYFSLKGPGSGTGKGIVIGGTRPGVYKVDVDGFGSDGITIDGSSTNTNVGTFIHTRSSHMGGHGWVVSGVNANLEVFVNCDASNDVDGFRVASSFNLFLGTDTNANTNGYHFLSGASVNRGFIYSDGTDTLGVLFDAGSGGNILQFDDSTTTVTDSGSGNRYQGVSSTPSFWNQLDAGAFASTSANAASGASSGVLKLSATDTICWRNNANSANACLSRAGGSDSLLWPNSINAGANLNGVTTALTGNINLTETTANGAGATLDTCYGDSTAHALECSYNNGTFGIVPLINRAQTWSAAQSYGAGQILPTSAGLAILGTTALPIGTVQIGTAATNNFALTPSATGQATAVSLLDPKAATAAVSWQGGIPCTNGELALSAGWGTTATVTAVVGLGWSCEWTVTSSGTGQAANPTITDTLVLPVLSASVACEMRMVGGTGAATLIDQTTLSATAPVFTFGGTPVAASTYKVYRRC